MTDLVRVWAYLSESPLLWLAATLVAFVLGDGISRLSGRRPFANPTAISVVILGGLLLITGTRYDQYFEGAQFVHFLLGPATVALAVPIYRNFPQIRRLALPMIAALLSGSLVAVLVTIGLGKAFGLDAELIRTMAPKSATAPVAVGISDAIGGSTTLTAAMVILTGLTGAIFATPLLNLLGIRDWRARGFATGVVSHGIGTARAFQVHETAGAFASIGMGLNALLTAILVPLVISLL